MSDPKHPYPRPDFHRPDLRWTSLNGEWDFLFDDEDIGLHEQWYRHGLPNESRTAGDQDKVDQSLVENLTQQITGSQTLIKNNVFLKKNNVHPKCKINVPFVFQTEASGVHLRDAHETLWYERQIENLISQEDKTRRHRLILRFGAVDYWATVWVDGQYVGDHQGGHVPFDMDITEFISSSSRLTVRVQDSTDDLTQPRGKQYWGAQPESIFYTPSSGIWQHVWLEVVPSTRIADSSHGTVLRSNDIDSGILHATLAVLGRRSGQKLSAELEAVFHGVQIVKSERHEFPGVNVLDVDLELRLGRTTFEQLPSDIQGRLPWEDVKCFKNGLALWSPSYPSLYDIHIRLFDSNGHLIDHIQTQTGMRKLSWKSGDNTLRLNDEPLFQKLCLDQGYWPRTGLTPSDPSSCERDILLAQSFGFNGCRKHQKLEDPLFLYYADKHGYLVWSEMASAYAFSAAYCTRFSREWEAAVKRDINHPCIITWTTANESWAYTDLRGSITQRNHLRSLYRATKVLDATRPINDNCGWEHVCTDLTTFHDYADAPQLKETCSTLRGVLGYKAGRRMFCPTIAGQDDAARCDETAPVVCTEFGGVNIARPADADADADAERNTEWGYTTASDGGDLLQRIAALAKAVVGEGSEMQGVISGFVWTQFTDVEQEANGLCTFDRKPKIESHKVKAIFAAAEKAYFVGLEKRNVK